MRNTLFVIPFIFFLLVSCAEKEHSHQYKSITIQEVFEDSMSIRAIEFLDENTLAFAGSNGLYGSVDVKTGKVRSNQMKYDTLIPSFRAVAHTDNDFFMLSVGSPALLYKTGNNGNMELVYKEEGESVFYDAMKFWNNLEGMAIGDYSDGCFAIVITRDGGKTWNRLNCDLIPDLEKDVGAYAASNTNIAIVGNSAWVMTSKEQVLFSSDKGETWEAINTPIDIVESYQGIYSIDFYDDMNGFGIGGDFSKPELNFSNKIKTSDGGKSWHLVAEGKKPTYKSCVQYVPNSGAEDLVAVGFTGIDYSSDGGANWNSLSDEGFYTIRFLNDSVAYAAGKNRIARIVFK